MKPRLYLETTIPSYLVARRSALARICTDQQTTQDWWDFHRHEYDLFVSPVVMREAANGDAEFAANGSTCSRAFHSLQTHPNPTLSRIAS